MVKAKRNVLASLLVLLLSCAILLTAGAVVSARAANDYSVGANSDTDNEYAVYPGTDSKETVLKALNDKVKELNAAIEEVNADDSKTLEEAYNAGEILVYSNIEGSNGLITSDNSRSNWKTWDSTPVADLKRLNAGYDGWGDNYVGWFSYSAKDHKAYIITAQFAKNYSGDGKKLGVAVGDMFRVTESEGYTAYQNFAGGYMKSVNGGSVQVVTGKNVDAQGAEIAADPVSAGHVGAANDTLAANVGVTKNELTKAFADAYNRYETDGFNVGYPFTVVKREGDLTLQYFRNGDSVSDPWGEANRRLWAYLAYNADEARAYVIKDEFAYLLDANGDAKKIGAPIGEVFLASDGNRYQNYEKGYMKAEGETPKNVRATFKTGYNVGADGVESEISIATNIGAFGPTVKDENIPSKYTRETFSAAFKAAYTAKVEYADGESLASVQKVAYTNGYFSQTYTDNNGKNHLLIYLAASDSFTYLRPAVADKMAASLGLPIGERIEVASVEGQKIYAYPFQNGYIKLTVSEQEKIQGGEAVTVINESAVMTQGATYDSEKVFFETTSYAESFVPGMVQHTTSGDNASVDAAYWSIWGVEQPSDEAIAGAFKTAYEEAFAMGFSAGRPVDVGILFWKSGNSGVIKITLQGGNGNANFWGDNTLMTYNPETGKAHISTGNIANCYANEGASGNGWATTDMLVNTKTGKIVQQFDITDTVVTHRQVYIIEVNGVANKVEGEAYDFDANKDGGEWVPYLSQFGGSISASPVADSQVKAGEKVSIDFGSFVSNADGYVLNWKLVSDKGALDANGKYTLDAMTATDLTVTVEVYSAFDKLTLTAKVKDEGSATVDPEKPGEDDGNGNGGETGGKKKGCKSTVAGGSIGLALGALLLGAALTVSKKRKNNA